MVPTREEDAMKDSRSIDAWLRTPVSRRAFLGGLAVCGIAPARLAGALAPRRDVRFRTSPFTLGVASGDPTAEGVVLWTRLAPDPLTGGGMPPVDVEVSWLIAADDRLRKVVRRGQTVASPEWAHSVHVEAEGLDPARWYWYQFRAGDQLSPIGRTRTLPREGAATSRLRFAFVSCQNYEIGYFTAYRHAAAEDLDVIFHLGDYIYEGAGSPGRPRSHAGPELITLDDYRTRYAVYKTDADLQAAHAAFPWIVTWDDHEVQNNYAGAVSQDNDPPEVFLTRRAAAYQAYYEHMPLRTSADGAVLATLSPVLLRHARVVLRARHAAVPHGSAVRRWRPGALSRRVRSRRPRCSAPTRSVGCFAVSPARALAGTSCRSRS